MKMDIAQAVAFTGISRTSIQAAAAAGKIPGAEKDDNRWTFTLTGLREWKRGRRQMLYHR